MDDAALDLFERWKEDPKALTGDEIVEVAKCIAAMNASAPRGTSPIQGPQLPEIVLAYHPTLICTDGERVEWFVHRDGFYEPVPSITNVIGDVLHELKIPTEGWAKAVLDVRTALMPLCAIRDLARTPLRIDLATRRATPFEKEPGVAGVVACKSKIYVIKEDGDYFDIPYDRTTFILNRLPSEPDFTVKPVRTNAWVEERLGPDQAIAYWDWASYCLTPKNTLKRVHLWLGETDSGKSTGVRLLVKILGEHNVSYYTATDLLAKFIRAELRGKLLNVAEEDPGYGNKFEATIKTISGGTAIAWEVKYGASGGSVPTFKCMFTSNNPATWVDSSGAFARRMVVLQWGPSIPQSAQRPMAEFDRMFEEEMPGILAQLLTRRLEIASANDIYVPEESNRLVAEIARESNSVATWLDEATQFDLAASVTKEHMYEKYAAWCKASGNNPYGYQTFWRKIRQHPDWKAGRIREQKEREGQGRLRKIYGLTFG